MDYSKAKFKYNSKGVLEGWMDGKKLGEIYSMGDMLPEAEKNNREDGWVTMSGLHVLIDDATGTIMSGPLKGQQYKTVLQTKKQKSEAKKQAKKAEKQSKNIQKEITAQKSFYAVENALKKVKPGDSVKVGMFKTYTRTATGWEDSSGSPVSASHVASDALAFSSATVESGYTSKAISKKLDSLPAGTTFGTTALTLTKQANGHWTDQTGSTDLTPGMMAANVNDYAKKYGANSCTITKPGAGQKQTATQSNTNATSKTTSSSLTQTLQANAKTMKLKDFKQSMKDGMEAASTGTKVDWGGKTYVKQSDGSWQYVDADGKSHKTTAKNVAHLATLKGADNQPPTKKAKTAQAEVQSQEPQAQSQQPQTQATQGGTISDRAGYDAAMKAHKAADSYYNTATREGHKGSPTSAADIQKQCNVNIEDAELMRDALWDYSLNGYKAIKKASLGDTSDDTRVEQADALESFILMSPKCTSQIHRGYAVSESDYNSIIAKAKQKGEARCTGIESWTTDQSVAEDFAEMNLSTNDRMIIEVMPNGTTMGTSIEGISKCSGEMEVLCSAQMRKNYTGKIWTADSVYGEVTFLEVEEVI